MALINCSECAAEVSSEAETCPSCGVRIKPKKSIWKWILGVPVGLFVALLIFGSLNSNPERDQKRRALDLCLEQLNDPTVDADSKRLIVKPTCEKLRKELN